MEKIKPYKAKIVKNGTGFHIHIPSYISKYLDLDVGDLLDVELKLIERKDAKRLLPDLVTQPLRFKGVVA